ncbi:hypothetical protein GAP32_394 [Cronobacter phage vB_CsaM_GAP32]|uniref:Uncharacterized protein n=1 Tax=Cronobacter phage vB_CsaM_GAP32 TaxID=1141136 RepID=K4F6E9_9CAUD|nr:hypothetical protein GAP32_394 [Cronobacter phage vB_CsaM_GAP32]AFC21846.1 hypothetical protein GAP32_394 [Cronobacter phage vB_CsaM_GAP32]
MEIDFKLVRKITHDLEMNGRQFIIRSRQIDEMKNDGTYDVKHGQDLQYFHIVSSMGNAVLEKIFMYFELRGLSDEIEKAFRENVEKAYAEYKERLTHSGFLSEMDRKYCLNYFVENNNAKRTETDA